MQRLKSTQVAPFRLQQLAKQGGVCRLCQRKPAVPCLDHCHRNGWCRGVLCRGCNALLGKLENNRGRYGLAKDVDFFRFLAAIPQYLAEGERSGLGILHNTHKTEDEKRLARNAAARKRRAGAK